MTWQEIKDVLAAHRKWLRGEDGGSRAILSEADLSGADLRGAILRRAILRRADLSDAILSDAILSEADLSDAILSEADLSEADLSDAILSEADLSGAILRGADLRGAILRRAILRRADLSGADLRRANLPAFQIPPETGAFIGWKKAADAILKLQVPASAGRTSSLVGRKCRASAVKVLAAYVDGKPQPKGSTFKSGCGGVYTVGETYAPDSYDPDIRVECTHGVHFFITRSEAEKW